MTEILISYRMPRDILDALTAHSHSTYGDIQEYTVTAPDGWENWPPRARARWMKDNLRERSPHALWVPSGRPA